MNLIRVGFRRLFGKKKENKEEKEFSRLRHLGQSEPVRILGSGSFGVSTVYECKGGDCGKKCGKGFVIKNIYKDERVSEQMIQWEYEIGSLLQHRNIVKALDVNLNTRRIVFEYMRSIDMYDAIDRVWDRGENDRKRGLNKLMKCFVQIVDALEYMNGLGCAHMDVKPENVIVSMDMSEAKLIDLGSVVMMGERWITNGTESYIPPEVFGDGWRGVWDKVDVWSSGVMLYEILYGGMPWNVANGADNRYWIARNGIKKGELVEEIFGGEKEWSGISEAWMVALWKIFMGVFWHEKQGRMSIQKVRTVLREVEHEDCYKLIKDGFQ